MEPPIETEGVFMKKIRLVAFIIAIVALLASCGKDNNEQSGDAGATADNSTVITSVDSGVGTFYCPDENFNNYLSVEKEFDGTPQNVVEILFELGNYGDNKVNVNDWYIKGGIMYIDFDQGLKRATGSTAQEYFSIYGTVKTLKSCFGVEKVRLTVNGEDFNTEHGAYDLPL